MSQMVKSAKNVLFYKILLNFDICKCLAYIVTLYEHEFDSELVMLEISIGEVLTSGKTGV